MDLEIIRETIDEKITVFKTKEEVGKWLENTQIKASKENIESIKNAFYTYYRAELEDRINEILDTIGVYTFNYEMPEFSIQANHISFNAKAKMTAAGTAIAGGAILLIEGALGPVGWFAIAASALLSWMLGDNFLKGEIIKTLFNNAVNAQNKISIELKCLVDTMIENENAIQPKLLESGRKLSIEQLQIKKFIEERNIRYLVHFTRVENVESIKKYGLLSVQQMEERSISFIRNDFSRFDNQLNGISLSITHINESLYKKFRMNNNLSNYTIIKINPAILYLENNPRLYCQTNAATATGHKGSSFEDLEAMFADTVSYVNSSGSHPFNRIGKARNETTDPQAEILWFNNIPQKYLEIDYFN